MIEFTHPEDNSNETDNSSDNNSTRVLPIRFGQGKPHSWKGFEDSYTNVTTNGKIKQYAGKSITENLRGKYSKELFQHQTRKIKQLEY